MHTYLGIEIGGSKLPVAIGDGAGQIIERRRLPVDSSAGAAGIRAQIEATLTEWLPRFKPAAIGVGFGGPVDWRQGTIFRSHQVEGWSGFPLRQWLHDLSRLPVAVENDANTGALGEALYGAGQGADPVFYITLGSGVGGGLVVNGMIYHGAIPGEAEIGHVRLDRQGTLVESVCSGWAVDARIRRAISQAPESALAALARGMSGGEARVLAEACARDDPAAMRIFDDTTDALAFALSHVAHLFHPQMIVLGGGLSLMGQELADAVQERLPEYLMEVFHPGPTVRLAARKEDAVPLGALHLARAAAVAK